jgi:hypothetical protein
MPANLLDVQFMDGTLLYLADRKLSAIAAITADGEPATVAYKPWLMGGAKISLHRSTQMDTVQLNVQNVSGESVVPDMERILRASSIEGAMAVLRIWDAGGEFVMREFHGTLTMESKQRDAVTISLEQLLASSRQDSHAATYGENCNLVWAEKRCGADPGGTECKYSFATCQVPERFMGVVVNFEPNFSDSVPAIPTATINRRRRI